MDQCWVRTRKNRPGHDKPYVEGREEDAVAGGEQDPIAGLYAGSAQACRKALAPESKFMGGT
jgi:hypothetical protein